MPSLVLDTLATIWYLEMSSQLSPLARAAIQAAIAGGDPVFVSSVTIVELIYLIEKRHFPTTLLDNLLAVLRQPASGFQVAPFGLSPAISLRTVSRSIRDMPDRMIAATAVALGLPLVTRDRQIQSSGIPVVW